MAKQVVASKPLSNSPRYGEYEIKRVGNRRRYLLYPRWTGRDLNVKYGEPFVCHSKALMERATEAMLDGVLIRNAFIATDEDGVTYPRFKTTISATITDGDLKRLGY